MFGAIKKLVRNIESLSVDMIVINIVNDEPDVKDLIIELNTQGQLFQGIDSKGRELSSIGGSYSPITVQIKRLENQPFDRVTLKDTGDFYRSFDVRAESGGIVITSDSIKDGVDLTDRWGSDIVGLNEMSLQELRFFLLPLVREFILKHLLNGI